MKETRLVKISKYLSYHLRHHPDKLGLKLKPGGWVSVDDLLDAAKKDKFLTCGWSIWFRQIILNCFKN
jgi:putative RNA 2'-phosphotransferase